MDRINGADTIDIGGGRRGFRDENLVTGTPGTEVTALHMNSVQEEILKVITEAGLIPNNADWAQLWQALQILGLSSDSRSRRWTAVLSMTLSSAPGAPTAGDTYLIPTGATGVWATHVGAIAQWTGSAWSYLVPPDGHGIGLPDGRVFLRIGGSYVQKIALDAQSGKWTYAVAGGTANALTVTLNPAPATLVPGMVLDVAVLTENTGAATLDVNGFGAVPIRTMAGAALQRGDLASIVRLVYSGTVWLLGGGLARSEVPLVPTADVVLYVRTDGNDNNDGGANTAARALATIQRAIDVITTRFSTSASFGVRIVLGNPGTYAPAINNRYPGSITIEGGGDAYIITSGAIGAGAPASFASRAGRVTLKGLMLENTTSSGTAFSAGALGGFITLDTINFRSLLNNPNYMAIYVVENGVCTCLNQLVVNGGDNVQRQMRALIHTDTGGIFNGAPGTSPCTIFIAPTTWAAGAAEAVLSSVARFANITMSPSGSFAGPRFNAASGGVIDTSGGGANYFPGSAAGTINGGFYY